VNTVEAIREKLRGWILVGRAAGRPSAIVLTSALCSRSPFRHGRLLLLFGSGSRAAADRSEVNLPPVLTAAATIAFPAIARFPLLDEMLQFGWNR